MEDTSRARVGHAAENSTVLRRPVLNALRQERTVRVRVKVRRYWTGRDQTGLLNVLAA